MYLDNNIFFTTLDLMPQVPLNIYGLRGSEYSILIDTGIKSMRDQVLALCNEIGNVKNVLITHVHADHIGCNISVKKMTNSQFFSAGAIPWIENMETHYLEFCIPSEHLPDSKEQREEILGLMEGPIHVDATLKDGMIFRPGNNIELETIAIPGHKLEEVGFLNRSTGDFFTGDILLALAAPFFHGFQSAKAFKGSLNKISKMIEGGAIKRVFASHHHPLNVENAISAIRTTEKFLDEVYDSVLIEAKGIHFPALWKNVCYRMNKQLEFRGFAMLEAQVNELIDDGILINDNGRLFRK
ncbi:MAG: MBL fold metallo-hydrolase [Ignavibacteriaceae bacterium]|nr:MBL fold metallo-hydrolase [Ignavibacteriaceae bacterium]